MKAQHCTKCYPIVVFMDVIEIIDWEYELITNNENLKK